MARAVQVIDWAAWARVRPAMSVSQTRDSMPTALRTATARRCIWVSEWAAISSARWFGKYRNAVVREIPASAAAWSTVGAAPQRVKVRCANCGSHLDDVFEGEGCDVPTDQRYCINSISLRLEPAAE